MAKKAAKKKTIRTKKARKKGVLTGKTLKQYRQGKLSLQFDVDRHWLISGTVFLGVLVIAILLLLSQFARVQTRQIYVADDILEGLDVSPIPRVDWQALDELVAEYKERREQETIIPTQPTSITDPWF